MLWTDQEDNFLAAVSKWTALSEVPTATLPVLSSVIWCSKRALLLLERDVGQPSVTHSITSSARVRSDSGETRDVAARARETGHETFQISRQGPQALDLSLSRPVFEGDAASLA